MKKTIAYIAALGLGTFLIAQSAGIFTASGTLTINAGAIVMIGTPGAPGTANYTGTISGKPLCSGSVTPPATPVSGVSITCTAGPDSIAGIFKAAVVNGKNVVQYDLVANGTAYSGVF